MSKTKTNIQTRIRCKACQTYISHQYNCECDDYWGYCQNVNGRCDRFYCGKCKEEKKVSWEDEEPMPDDPSTSIYAKMSKAQKSTFNLILDEPEIAQSEKDALRAMMMKIATPGCGYTG